MTRPILKQNIILSRFRNSTISKRMLGLRVQVYNGVWPLTKLLDERMVGLKLGEFSHTKRFDGQNLAKRRTRRKTKKTK